MRYNPTDTDFQLTRNGLKHLFKKIIVILDAGVVMEDFLRCNRVYLPPSGGEHDVDIDLEEHLVKYTNREFPEPVPSTTNVVYSVPRVFQKAGERQACKAELVVFERLHGLSDQATNPTEINHDDFEFNNRNSDEDKRTGEDSGSNDAKTIEGLWLLFFHNASYAGRSFRNQRLGKLMIREHDFVIFARYKGRFFMVLTEVKSTNDANTTVQEVTVTSDAKVIKNNKRSAQHQLRDHMEVLRRILQVPTKTSSQSNNGSTNSPNIKHLPDENQNQTDNEDLVMHCHIMWPFLGPVTKDPKQVTIRRWREDGNLHVFRDVLADQAKFNEWFEDTVLRTQGISERNFVMLLSRYLILSCGVFMDEIHTNILALLTQTQLEVLNTDLCRRLGGPMVVHGAAGTGKSLLVLRKLEQLHQHGQLNDQNRALYVCYWPGIRTEVEQKLELLGIRQYVDTARVYITQTGFLQRNPNASYKHIFVDEAEVLSLVFEEEVLRATIRTINERYHKANCRRIGCTVRLRDLAGHDCDDWGELWFLVDVNQSSLFMPKYSMEMLQIPNIVLSTVMRCTGYIFQVFKQFYINPVPYVPKDVQKKLTIPALEIGHDILGPPVYWVPTCTSPLHLSLSPPCTCALVRLIVDLCSTKGVRPNDICVIPFQNSERYLPAQLNTAISTYFVPDGYRPNAVDDVERFVINTPNVETTETTFNSHNTTNYTSNNSNNGGNSRDKINKVVSNNTGRAVNDFLVAWALRLKGLEFKIVVIAMDTEDGFDIDELEDRRKAYIMASRCTCMLIFVCPAGYIGQIDMAGTWQKYQFSPQFQ